MADQKTLSRQQLEPLWADHLDVLRQVGPAEGVAIVKLGWTASHVLRVYSA